MKKIKSGMFSTEDTLCEQLATIEAMVLGSFSDLLTYGSSLNRWNLSVDDHGCNQQAAGVTYYADAGLSGPRSL